VIDPKCTQLIRMIANERRRNRRIRENDVDS
jgi:hypothetical protein